MIRKAAFFLLLLFPVSFTFSQKVDSIKVEQSGDFIKIGYKITDSKPGEIYRVRVLASINGGLNTELESVSGDTGDHVPGGKNEYWVLWDVLKDVEEVRSVDFIVRAELLKSIGKKYTKPLALQGSLQVQGPGFGARFSYLGKYGVSWQYINAKPVLLADAGTFVPGKRLSRFSLDLASRLVNKENFKMHLLTGATVGHAIIHETQNGDDYNIHLTPGLEGGFAFSTADLVFSLAGSFLLTGMTEEGEAISYTNVLTVSLGFRF